MNLLIHDRSDAPAPQGVPFLSIDRGGTFSICAAAVTALGLKEGQPVLLAESMDTGRWYLCLQPNAARKPFVLRNRDKEKSRAMLFCSTSKARAYYRSAGHDSQKVASVRLQIDLKPLPFNGMILHQLQPESAIQAMQEPVKAAPKAAPKKPAPAAVQEPAAASILKAGQVAQDAIVRVKRAVAEFGGMQLRRCDQGRLNATLDLLSQHRDVLDAAPGARKLLDKLEDYFAVAA